jgi:hypothetical protein
MRLLCASCVYYNENGSLPAGSRFRLIADFIFFVCFLSKVSLCFSRDPYVCLQLCSKFGSRAQTTSRFAHAPDISSSASGGSSGTGGRADGDAIGGQSSVTTSAFPPSSCIPFYGWAMYGTFGIQCEKANDRLSRT